MDDGGIDWDFVQNKSMQNPAEGGDEQGDENVELNLCQNPYECHTLTQLHKIEQITSRVKSDSCNTSERRDDEGIGWDFVLNKSRQNPAECGDELVDENVKLI